MINLRIRLCNIQFRIRNTDKYKGLTSASALDADTLNLGIRIRIRDVGPDPYVEKV